MERVSHPQPLNFILYGPASFRVLTSFIDFIELQLQVQIRSRVYSDPIQVLIISTLKFQRTGMLTALGFDIFSINNSIHLENLSGKFSQGWGVKK